MLLYAVFEEIKTDLLFSSKNCSQIMNLLVDHL